MKIKEIFGKVLKLFKNKNNENEHLEKSSNIQNEQLKNEPGENILKDLKYNTAFEALNRLDDGSEFYQDIRGVFKKSEKEYRENLRFLELNLKGKEFEKVGQIDEAIQIYEENIANCFTGSFPYNRLAIIYRKRKDYNNEIRILQKAIGVFEELSDSRADKAPKLEGFSERMRKAMALMNRE